jgi:trans-2,3-dihydro-3-hydroxyanthranilate isomerase
MSTSGVSRILSYALLDVFAIGPFTGNPLAVFPDASGLAAAQMQNLAREMNLSETTFILPRAPEVEREQGVKVRIFTTQEELPFAGHPILGTAAWLYLHHPVLAGSPEIVVSVPGGDIQVRFREGNYGPGVYGTVQQNDPEFGQFHNREAVARSLGLALDDLDPVLPIQTVSTGLAFCIVPLRSIEAAGRLKIPRQAAQNYLDGTDAKFFYAIARADEGSGADWHARMQFYSGEDPATGSASGCAIAWLVRHGLAKSNEPVVLEQGVEIGRPSRIDLQADRDGIRIRNIRVGGRTVLVARGEFLLVG